jgi:predicted TIM-barrel fold metal-dependent hydrolase
MGHIMAGTSENDPGRLAVLRLLGTGKCWVKLSGYRSSIAGPPFTDVALIARMLIEHAGERCVWGTDWPHPNMHAYMPDDGNLLDLLADWTTGEGTLRQILVDNPAKLYGFA